jgi:hypothetical protein
MSSVPGGRSNIFIGAGQTQLWTFTLGSAGWQGNILIEADPIAPGPSLTCSQQGVRLSGVNYAFDFSVNNLGAAGLYNVEVSAN